ncbi:CCR4-NOT transcription complex subunit 10-like [Styela clava]
MAEKEDLLSSNNFTEEEQRCASDAYDAFLRDKYDSCISGLKKIQKNHPGDCKLMHNRALAEYYKSGLTKTADLKKALSKVHKVTQQSHQEDDEITEEITSNEYSVLHYNQSLLYYFLHQYREAQTLLQALAENPEVAINVREICLLLVEVYLTNYEPEKAVRLINKIEETFLKPVSPQQSKHGNTNDGKDKAKPQKINIKEMKNLLPLLKTRCCLQLKSMKACKRELKAFTSLESSPDFPAQTIQFISVFLKSNFEFQRGNFHKAYKLLGSSPPSSSVNTSWLQNGESLSTMFYNNLGVIHFYTSKHSLGTFYLSKAIEENDKAISTNTTSSKKGDSKQQQSSNTKTIQMLNMNKKFELLYNMGIQLLFSGKPSAGFDCLIAAVPVFSSNPRLWLRLAECCIQWCCSPDKSDAHNSQKHLSGPLRYTVVGSGIHQKLILHPITQNWNGAGNSVMPGPTLEFASVCLQNALTILAEAGITGEEIKEGRKNSKSDINKKPVLSIPCLPGNPLAGQELSNFHASILANGAFVALSLGNNLMAYEYSKLLLRLPNISGRHKYLGRMYSAEALVSLDRISDAIQHLSGDSVSDMSDGSGDSGTRSQSHSDDLSNQVIHRPTGPKTTQICFKSPQHAQGCMLLNLAVAHTLRSEFEKAQKLLNQFASLISPQEVPPNAILLAVYINIHMEGGLPLAMEILQHNSLTPHMNSSAIGNLQTHFRPQQPLGAPGAKQFSSTMVANSPNGMSSSNGSISGGSSGSRSKSSTPQPQYSNPPSGSVTPERIVKGSTTKSDSGNTKTKRGRR